MSYQSQAVKAEYILFIRVKLLKNCPDSTTKDKNHYGPIKRMDVARSITGSTVEGVELLTGAQREHEQTVITKK